MAGRVKQFMEEGRVVAVVGSHAVVCAARIDSNDVARGVVSAGHPLRCPSSKLPWRSAEITAEVPRHPQCLERDGLRVRLAPKNRTTGRGSGRYGCQVMGSWRRRARTTDRGSSRARACAREEEGAFGAAPRGGPHRHDHRDGGGYPAVSRVRAWARERVVGVGAASVRARARDRRCRRAQRPPGTRNRSVQAKTRARGTGRRLPPYDGAGGGYGGSGDRGYSYCSASSTFSLEARRAGRIAASIPARIAMPTKTTSVPYGTAKTMP